MSYLAKLCERLTMAEIEAAADVCIFAGVQMIATDVAPSVLFQSLKSPQVRARPLTLHCVNAFK